MAKAGRTPSTCQSNTGRHDDIIQFAVTCSALRDLVCASALNLMRFVDNSGLLVVAKAQRPVGTKGYPSSERPLQTGAS
jgi:predicted NAD/FAD-binding protein